MIQLSLQVNDLPDLIVCDTSLRFFQVESKPSNIKRMQYKHKVVEFFCLIILFKK